MGMFDDLYFEKSPFPKEPEIVSFQTKSLDNVMDSYRVTKDGILQVSEFKLREAKPEEQTDIKGAKFPLWVREHTKWGDTDITGTIEAYTWKENIYYSIAEQIPWSAFMKEQSFNIFSFTLSEGLESTNSGRATSWKDVLSQINSR